MEEKEMTYRIPDNCTSGFNILGKAVPVRNALEALLTAAAFLLPLILFREHLSLKTLATAATCSVLLPAAFVLPGIDGISFYTFLGYILRYVSRRSLKHDAAVSGHPKKEKTAPHRLESLQEKRKEKPEDPLEAFVLPVRKHHAE